ncbi:hypothetical protein L915_17282 [Phytophthora nicotianae]|uniref:Ubiquitin-like protease family profile domain-containing protein n=1 Tax=Phytophthora nicotianae TaxID=4792 RepID=W2I8K8_PHYNI|nr:hypothetical protein L915_17282 [Phytophthora nicotianae]ETL29718.1 hypothetical protein L916_17175 [Phytophthora nicotianae]
MLTNSVVDFCITRFTRPTPSLSLACTSVVFFFIACAYANRSTPNQSSSDLQGDWSTYKYVLLPINLQEHWSFVEIQNCTDGSKLYYHIDSVQGGHDSKHIFAVLDWANTVLAARSVTGTAYSYETKPRQSNPVDCGIYMLHYVYKIKTHIDNHKPASIMWQIEALTKGGFKVSKISQARNSLQHQLAKIVEYGTSSSIYIYRI